MRIENLRTEQNEDRLRHAVTVVWEDCERPRQDVYFEASETFAQGFFLNPDAFLLGCALPAMHHGERRIAVDAKVCPAVTEGLNYVMATMRHWFYEPGREPIRIETKGNGYKPDRAETKSAGALFSSGVDSLALLWNIHLQYPKEHPWSIRNAIIILGQNIESDMSDRTLEQAVKDFSALTADVGAMLIPVYTNIRSLENDGGFFLRVNHGAIMASVAHIFAQRLHTTFIASSDSLGELAAYKQLTFSPWGSHPLIDNYYSSPNLQIRHENLTLTRLDKLRIVAGWDAGLQTIRVCGKNWPGMNCGKCEKCTRTMLGLLALGVLDKTKAFPTNDLTEDQVKKLRVKPYSPRYNTGTQAIYFEVIPHLERAGRHEIVRAIRQAATPRKWSARVKAMIKRLVKR